MENSSSDTNDVRRPSPGLLSIENFLISAVGLYLHFEEIFILRSKFDVNFSSFLFTQSSIIAILSYLNSIKTPEWVEKKNVVIQFVYKMFITLLISNVLQTITWVYFNKALYVVCHNFAQSIEASIYGTALPRIRPITEWIKHVPYYVIRNTVSVYIFYKTLSIVGAFDCIRPRKPRRVLTQSTPATSGEHIEPAQPQSEVTLIFLPDTVSKYFAHKTPRAGGRDRSSSRVYDLRPRGKRTVSRERKNLSPQR